MTDPIERIRRRTLLTRLVAGPLIIAMALWSLVPIQRPDLGSIAQAHPENDIAQTAPIEPLDLAAFDAPIWQEPKDAQATTLADTQARPTVRFPDLELIAIIRDGEQFRAAVYLPSIDQLIIAGIGEPIGAGLSVSEVTADAVELERAGHARRFELKKPQTLRLGAAG